MTLTRRHLIGGAASVLALIVGAWTHGVAVLTQVLSAVVDGQYGEWNISNGTQGPYWVGLDVWNLETASYTGNFATANNSGGQTTVTGFSSTAGITVGMSCYSNPAATSDSPWPTVVSVAPTSVVLSSVATTTTTGNQMTFGLVAGSDYNETISVNQAAFPNGTVLSWSYPSELNDSSVYAYPELVYGTNAYNFPANTPTAKQVNAFSNLSVTFNVTRTSADTDADCMFECWSSNANPISPTNMTNEISFFMHTPATWAVYITGQASHFNYSAGGFNAYIALRPGTALTTYPPQVMIMPVTTSGGTTPLDLTSGTQTIPVLAVLQAIVTEGWLVATDYISGMEFGCEVGKNSGTLTFNSIAWTWS